MDDAREAERVDRRNESRAEAPARPDDRPRPDETEAPAQNARRQAAHNNAGGDKAGDGKAGADGKRARRSPVPLIVLGIAIVVAAVGGGIYWFLTKDQTDTDDAYTDGRAISIAPQVPGYVVTLAVTDNQFVHKGDLLVQIDQRDYVAARDQARAAVMVAHAQANNARLGSEIARKNFPARLAQAQGQLAQARGQLFQAQTDYARQHNINKAATTQQSIDQSTAQLQLAQGQVQAAEAMVTQAQPVQQNIGQSDAQADQLEAQVKQAEAQLAQAELNLGYTRIVAPQDGWVTRRNVETGNYLQAGAQIMNLVAPEVWVTANFKENQLNRMRPGQRVDISVDAYPGLKLRGHVDSVQLGSGSRFSAFPAENATGNFVKIVQRVPVKILIDSGLDPTIPLPVGLSVVPTVYLK